MLKMLFLDYSQVSRIQGFTRELEQPVKYESNPILLSEDPWEHGNFTMYGSVVKVEGKPFQMWYSVVSKPLVLHLAYAESDDGLVWNKPLFDNFLYEGKKTNIVLDDDIHGAAVIYDEMDPREDWKYKLVGGAGGGSKAPIFGFHSPDGINWRKVQDHPIITTGPDCPMGLLRQPDGRYVAYHRKRTYGRRVFRSESWDFKHWSSEPRMVLEADAGDPPMTQFYGLGSTPYGPYEIGSLWMYHVDPDDATTMRGYQEAEFVYARSGYAWHRAAQGKAFLAHGKPGEWDQGNLQCASSPLFLNDEIRYYYAGTNIIHGRHWEHNSQRAGLGMATIKPDRFVALRADDGEGELITTPCYLPSSDIRLNANVGKDGWVRVEIANLDGTVVEGYGLQQCIPVMGDSTSHHVLWSGAERSILSSSIRYRLRIKAKQANLYSLFVIEPGEKPHYTRFSDFISKEI